MDGNGFRDPTDSALEGIDVTITDANGNVTNDTTDALGRYNASVVFGPVQVAVDNDDIPEGYDLTTDNDNQSVEFTGGFSGLSDIGYQPGTIAGVPTDPDDSGSGFTHDTQFGGPGNDEISGGGGDDHIVGAHWQSATNHNVPINTGSYNASLASVPFLGTDFWEVNTAADLAQSGTITGRVWEDLNANHLENGGEPGVPDVLVTLVDAEGSVVAATLTNASGNYTFSDIYKGDYRVRITLPDGAALAQPDQGANNAVDSDFFSASLETTSNITLTAGGTQSNWDAGLVLGGAGSGDLAAGIGFSEVSYSVLENDPEGKATITVTRSSAFEPEGIVYFATDGTAVDGVNYVAVQGLLAFGVGDTEMSFEIPILNAGIPLGESRTVLLSLRLITGQPIANTSVLYIINGTAIEIEDDDTIDGGGDDDIILGDSGNIPGALDAGAMSLSDIEDAGGQGKDVIYGRSGLDFIFGGLDDDIIGGNDGTNIVLGGFGDDRIDAEIDDQTLDGGHGKDAVISTYNGHFELEEFAPGSGELRMINRRDGSVFSTFTLTSIEIAELTGGVLNNNFEITNWSGEAYLDGKGGSNDSIAVENDLDMILRDSSLSLFQALAFLLEHGFLKDAALALSNGSTWHLGSIENATLTGGSGNNLIDASDYSHAVTIEGGAGNDVLIGGIGANRFVFDADSLLGTDKVTGGGGTDTLDFSPTSASNPVTVDLGNTGAVAQFVNGNLFLLLTAEDIEIVIGTDGDDNLTGNSLANTLIGGAGDDDLAGAGGDDYYGYDLDLPWGNDTITENIGGGTDTLDFSSTNTVPVDVNLSAIGPYTVHPTNLSLEFLGDREIEWIIGGDQNDTIAGSATDNAFIDGPGDDSYDGAGGNDRVIAQANANFEVTATTLDYSGQTNLLTDIDRLELKGGNGDNLFSFAGWAGEAHVVGGDAPSGPFTPGFDRISATGDQDFTLTDAALTSPTGLSITSLRIDRWLLTGGASANTITANGFTLGPVEIRGLGGPDILVGGTQNDRIFGGAGNDQISGGPGADYADGGANNDTLIEASDSNFVFGPGTVQIVGGSADTLLNFENMNITGGPGSNLFDVSNWSGGNLTINGAGGVDQVNASADADYTLTNAALTIAPVGGSPITIGLASIEQVLLEGGASDNTFDGTGFTGITAWLGGEGDDTFLMDAGAGGGTFILLGDDGSDTADFSATSAATNINVDLANGANQPVGTLTVRLLGTTVENVIGGAGDDTLSGNAGDNVFSTGGGSDLIDGLGGTDTLREAHDSDYTMTAATKVAWASGAATFANLERLHISGGASGNNIDLSLFTGDSTVFGLGGDDTIVTGIGNDTIDGGSGNNLLRGSKGDDTYVYDVDALIGKDTIVEINGEGTDTIDFSATDLVSLFIDLGDTSLQTVDTTNGSPNLQIQLSAADGIENVIGGAQDDKFVGNALDNTFTGGEGDDDFDGVAGTNTVRESRDADFTLTDSKLTIDDGATVEEDNFSNIQSAYLEGGSGGNLLDASAFTQGGVTLDGGAGNDTLLGTAKNDVLLGGDGNDTLDAGAGDDSLTGGAGNDVLYGGIGDDDYFFDLSQQLGHDTIYEFLWLTFPGFVPVGGNDTIHGTLGVNLSDSSTQIISSNLALTLPFLNVENQVL
ncbi:MAG: SdrD B-like domain-containing protein [Verrucomicrobiales bacterium]